MDDFDGQCCRTYPYNHSRIQRWQREKRKRKAAAEAGEAATAAALVKREKGAAAASAAGSESSASGGDRGAGGGSEAAKAAVPAKAAKSQEAAGKYSYVKKIFFLLLHGGMGNGHLKFQPIFKISFDLWNVTLEKVNSQSNIKFYLFQQDLQSQWALRSEGSGSLILKRGAPSRNSTDVARASPSPRSSLLPPQGLELPELEALNPVPRQPRLWLRPEELLDPLSRDPLHPEAHLPLGRPYHRRTTIPYGIPRGRRDTILRLLTHTRTPTRSLRGCPQGEYPLPAPSPWGTSWQRILSPDSYS